MTTALEDLTSTLQARRALPAPEVRRALRLAAGASLAEVARACGVTKQAVAQWERGQNDPRSENLTAYVNVLDLLRRAT